METGQTERTLRSLKAYLETPLDLLLGGQDRCSPVEWALRLCREVAREVPAYAAFLKDREIDPWQLTAETDFLKLPLTTKEDYLSRYPLEALCRGGRIAACDMLAVSSGSTGTPTFWPRSLVDELGVAVRFEQVFHDSFEADRRRTLAVVCFALGTWVGGMYTASCCRHLAAKGYPITVVTPGNNKAEILRVVEALSPSFDQVVLLGYPPFIKDVIDTGRARGLAWGRYRIRLVFAGEVFSEEWRELVLERVGAAEPFRDSASLYGTADAGVLGNETPLSICIRRYLAQHPEAARELFGESRLPTLVQYDPYARYFEAAEGTLLFSGDNGVPLVRYHISDEGGLISFEAMLRYLAERAFDPKVALGTGRGVRALPFAFVFGRSHFVVSYFGANIYPENVTVGLEQPNIRDWVTGKFVMEVREDQDRDRHLHITVELAPDESASEARRALIAESILRELQRLNSEFAHYVPPAYQRPHIDLMPAGDPEWFPPGVKHRYSRPLRNLPGT